MTQTAFASNAAPTLPLLDQNFTQLYDLRELISSPSYAAATPKATLDASYNWCVAKTSSSWKGNGSPTIGQTSSSIGSLATSLLTAVDTGLSVNAGSSGACLLLMASRNVSTGLSTDSAMYLIRFYFDGNNAPTTVYIGGSTNFVAFGMSGGFTLTLTNAGGGNAQYTWLVNKG